MYVLLASFYILGVQKDFQVFLCENGQICRAKMLDELEEYN